MGRVQRFWLGCCLVLCGQLLPQAVPHQLQRPASGPQLLRAGLTQPPGPLGGELGLISAGVGQGGGGAEGPGRHVSFQSDPWLIPRCPFSVCGSKVPLWLNPEP